MTKIPQTQAEYIERFGPAVEEEEQPEGGSALDQSLWTIYQKAVQETRFGSKTFFARSLKLPKSHEDQLCHLLAKRHGIILVSHTMNNEGSTIEDAKIQLPQIDPHRFASNKGNTLVPTLIENLEALPKNTPTLEVASSFQSTVLTGALSKLKDLSEWTFVFKSLSHLPPEEKDSFLKKISQIALKNVIGHGGEN